MDLDSLLDRVNRGEIRLPEIQRAYVWKPAQVAGLIDSLFRRYPSGSLLLWETNEPVGERHAAIEGPGKLPMQKPQYLLDGQQRLTSLFRVWEGDERAQVIFNVESQRFQIESAATKRDRRWISVHALLRNKVSTFDIANDIASHVESLTPEAIHERLERVKKISNYPYFVEIVDGLTYQEVTEIFVRVNSQGRRLRKVDLALATLSSRWPGVIDKLESRVVQHERAGYQHLDVGFLTRCLAALATDTATFDGFVASSTERLEDGWRRVQRGLDHLLPLLQQNAGIATSELLPSVNALVPLVALLGLRDDAPISEEETKSVVYWLFGAFLLGRFNQSVDTNIAQDVAAVRSEDPVAALYKNMGLLGHRLGVSSEGLALRGANSPYFLLSYLVARRRFATDWFFGVQIDTQLEGGLKLEYHHIHPRARLKPSYSKAQINDLSNLAFISSKANRKISNRRPADYFPELSEDDLARHLVPLDEELRSPEAYLDFLESRRALLAEAMTQLLDEYRPAMIESSSDPAVDPSATESLTINVYSSYPASSNGVAVLCSSTGSEGWTASVPLVDLIGFVEDLEDGLAASLTVGGETFTSDGTSEEIDVGVGPLWVTGSLQEWKKVLERELGEVNLLTDAPQIRTPAPWTRERVPFSILDSE